MAIFLIQRNRHALIGRAIDDHDMERVLKFLKNDPVKFAEAESYKAHYQFDSDVLYH